jgi:hypothetical protein
LTRWLGLLTLDDGAHCDEARQLAEHKLADVRAKLADPRVGCSSPVPKWKHMEMFADVLPRKGDN